MADFIEGPASCTAKPHVVRREEFINQFRIKFEDGSNRTIEWRFQSGEPVFYFNDNFSGYTLIKDISVAGVFTVHADPFVKNETALATKYIKKLSLDYIRYLIRCEKIPIAEEYLWRSWICLQEANETLYCQSGRCPNHEIKRWKWQQLERAMVNTGHSSEGYVYCRPCAENCGLVKPRSCPYSCGEQWHPPWRRRTKEEHLAQLKEMHEKRLQRKVSDLAHLPPEEHDGLKKMILEEVTKEYHADHSHVSEAYESEQSEGVV